MRGVLGTLLRRVPHEGRDWHIGCERRGDGVRCGQQERISW